MDKVRYGIIGVGNQGSHYAALFAKGEIADGVLSAVCDTNPVKLGKAREVYGDTIAYFDKYQDMLSSGTVDAVLVETPHYLHPTIVMYCIEHGVPVISDKPAGVYTKQVREANECALAHNVPYGMMFNQRTNCLYRKMREIIMQGGIGDLIRVNWIITNWYRTQRYYDSGSWRATWDGEGGGVLINQCPHQLDLVQWIVGKMPATVRGFCQYGKWHDIEVEDEVTAFFEYDNGATGVFITTTGEAPGSNRLEISGTLGKLLCENGELYYYKNAQDIKEQIVTCQENFKKPDCEKILVETDGLNPQHKGIINNFTEYLLGKEELFVQGTDGINGVELMNAIELSGFKNGEKITLPVDEEEYISYLNSKRQTSRAKVGDDNSVIDTNNTFWNVSV